MNMLMVRLENVEDGRLRFEARIDIPQLSTILA